MSDRDAPEVLQEDTKTRRVGRLVSAFVSLCLPVLFLVSCGGPSSRDYRADQQALTRVLAADAHTAELVDPVLDRIGQGQDSMTIVARLQGEVKDAAGRALRVAGEAKTKTPEGRALRQELVDAAGERLRVIELLAVAARTERSADLLDAITATRELEETLAGIDERVTKLGRRD